MIICWRFVGGIGVHAEAWVIGVRWAHPAGGPSRIVWQLERDGIDPVPGRSSVYRALVRQGLHLPSEEEFRYLIGNSGPA